MGRSRYDQVSLISDMVMQDGASMVIWRRICCPIVLFGGGM